MRLARRHGARSAAQQTAIEKACRAWQCEAALIRSEVRAHGVHGPLRMLDEMAGGVRGVKTPTQLAKVAAELRSAGVPRETAEARLMNVTRQIVAAAYMDTTPAA